MTTLLRAEWYKLLRSKITFVCLAGIVVLSNAQMTGENPLPGHLGVTLIARMSPFICILISAFVSFFVATEFQQGTIRNALALGKGRAQLYLSKQGAVFVATFLFVLLTAILAAAINTARMGFGDVVPTEFLRFFAIIASLQLLYHCVYAALFNLVAFVGKNPAATVLFGVGSIAAEMVAVSYLGQFGDIGLAMRQAFPYYYVSLLYSAGNGFYGYANSSFVSRGIVVNLASIALISVAGSYIFKRADVK
jgi:ABC-2 type transport system permease protein